MCLIDKYIHLCPIHVRIDIVTSFMYRYTVRYVYCMLVFLSEYIAGGVMIIEMKGDKHI